MGPIRSRKRIPENWNTAWVVMWVVVAPLLVVLAFVVPFATWVAAVVVGFLVPELISIARQDDSLPPLTHTIRHLLPDWMAFPAIYFALGSVGAHSLGFTRPVAIGLLMGLLGWLTDHFTVTYARPDPFPYSHPQRNPDTGRRRLPV